MQKPYVLAEIAGAHDGSEERLFQLIDAIGETGAHGVKFQLFQAEGLATQDHPQYAIWQRLSFTTDIWLRAMDKARGLGLNVWIDVFDDWAQDFCLKHEKKIYGYKFHATKVFDPRVPRVFYGSKKHILIGISGYEDSEVHKLVNLYSRLRHASIILEHGFQQYPTPLKEASLARIRHLKDSFMLPVAFADHTKGGSREAMMIPEYAYMVGASLIEKHVCLSRATTKYDYHSSLEPGELKRMVERLRVCNDVLGEDTPTIAQIENTKQVVVKPVLKRSIKKGVVVGEKDVTYLRSPNRNALTAERFQSLFPAVTDMDLVAGRVIEGRDVHRPRVIAVVPCRMKSTRLPKKALLEIGGMPSVKRALINIKTFPVSQVVLATSINGENDELVEYAKELDVSVVRGPEDDVLERIILAVNKYQAEYVIRCPADSIFASGDIMRFLIERHITSGYDLTTPAQPYSIGTAGEVYTVEALYKLRKLLFKTEYSEYLPMYFTNNPSIFTAQRVLLPEQFRNDQWRLTLDEERDLELFRKIYDYLKPGHNPVFYEQVAEFFAAYPGAEKINAGVSTKWCDDYELVRKITEKTTISKKVILTNRAVV